MTEETVNQQPEQNAGDKAFNFRQFEERYKRDMALERSKNESLQKELQTIREQVTKSQSSDEEEEEFDPYDRRKFEKTVEKYSSKSNNQTKEEVKQTVQQILQEERDRQWLDKNNDFFDVMKHADKLAEIDPELASTILNMPDNFERKKLVYKNIKLAGVHKPKQEVSAQDRINQNRRHPGYQSSGVATAPYASQGDFSQSGQKSAYDKIQELKKNLRL